MDHFYAAMNDMNYDILHRDCYAFTDFHHTYDGRSPFGYIVDQYPWDDDQYHQLPIGEFIYYHQDSRNYHNGVSRNIDDYYFAPMNNLDHNDYISVGFEYQANCINQWLLKGKSSCPICRSSVSMS